MGENRIEVANAFSAFSKKFARFNKAKDSERVEEVRKDSILQDKINSREERFEFAIISTYRIYKSPYEALGTKSARAKSIDDDQQSLLKAYNLFKSITEINEKLGDEQTFIARADIESTVCKKDSYTRGGQFIYLQCWLMFAQHAADYIPVLEERKEGVFQLKFYKAETVHFLPKDTELIEIVKKTFYS